MILFSFEFEFRVEREGLPDKSFLQSSKQQDWWGGEQWQEYAMHAKERQPRALTAIAMGLSNWLKCFQIDLLLDPVWGHSITTWTRRGGKVVKRKSMLGHKTKDRYHVKCPKLSSVDFQQHNIWNLSIILMNPLKHFICYTRKSIGWFQDPNASRPGFQSKIRDE